MSDNPHEYAPGSAKRKRLLREQRAAEKPEYDEFEEMREERRSRGKEKLVGWILTLVFVVTSVGFLAALRNPAENRVERVEQGPEAAANERLKALARRAAENPKDESAHFEMAQEYVKLRDLEKAQEELRATLALDPSHAEALRLLSRALLSQGKAKDAQDVLTRGIQAEAGEIAKRNRERAKDEPELFPDATLRALLVQCYALQGALQDSRVHPLAAEGLNLQPNDFAQEMAQAAFRLAVMQKKPLALALLDLSIKEAEGGNYAEVARQLQDARKAVDSFKVAPLAAPGATKPSASPRAGSPAPSEALATPAQPSSTPAGGPTSSTSPATSPSSVPGTP